MSGYLVAYYREPPIVPVAGWHFIAATSREFIDGYVGPRSLVHRITVKIKARCVVNPRRKAKP